jgi:hypothetical protein
MPHQNCSQQLLLSLINNGYADIETNYRACMKHIKKFRNKKNMNTIKTISLLWIYLNTFFNISQVECDVA